MGTFVKAAATSELTEGGKKKVVIQGKEILLAQVGGSYYAVGNRCMHMNGDLSLGKLNGKVITCPRHYSQYDVTSGQVVRWMTGKGLMYTLGKLIKSPRPLPVYQVKVEGTDILVEI